MTEQRRSPPSDQQLDLIRRIQSLAQRAERTAHNRSNLVGPPPSQEHLDILAEIRALTEWAVERAVAQRRVAERSAAHKKKTRTAVPDQGPRPVEKTLDSRLVAGN
ncbi:hypothetical protein [Saccharothrix coeruleofusca]|uniref:Uncharacterized protein n=1 Tax=Saccharothrix coeruleofusca TaxID=33919 RepID=A0A918AR38_9PSEU|nr:hypothetical protein [Saccharothrix coeruleofusca]MBP2334657.1 hypothetical protein [Saccharothrix coeruleofusca]GGP72956.1 hypothetical protein GCM10010185_52930 [Saccharothrix coeruleofusca]